MSMVAFHINDMDIAFNCVLRVSDHCEGRGKSRLLP